MDSRRIFRPRPRCVITHSGTVEQRGSGHVDRPSNRVGASRDGNARGVFGRTESFGVDTREKLSWGVSGTSVP